MFYSGKKQGFVDYILSNGYILFISSTVMFAFMGLFVKLAATTENIPIFEIVFFRSFINLVIIFIYARLEHKSLVGYNKKLLVMRSIVGFLAFTCYYFAISKISLADAVILFYVSPVFVSIFSLWFLRGEFSLSLLVGIFCALLGAVIVIRPSFEFFNYGGMYGLLSAILAATVFVSIRILSVVNSTTTIIFYFVAISSIISFPLAMIDFVVPSHRGILYILLIGVFSTFGQFGMTRGYRYLEAQKGSLISIFNVVFSSILSYFVLRESMDRFTIIGGLLVFLSSIGVLLFKPIFFHKHPKKSL